MTVINVTKNLKQLFGVELINQREFHKTKYNTPLQSMGYEVKVSGKVFDFRGQKFADTEGEAYRKLQISPSIYAPTDIVILDTINDNDVTDYIDSLPNGGSVLHVNTENHTTWIGLNYRKIVFIDGRLTNTGVPYDNNNN